MQLISSFLIMFAGIYLTLATGLYVPRKRLRRHGAHEGDVTPFEALSTALAGSIGTGNIAGVAAAMAAGGAGAVFWMWISALFGMTTKYVEIRLALKYARYDEEGNITGSPMNCMEHGMRNKRCGRILARIFAFAGILAALCGGALIQSSTAASAVSVAVVLPEMPMRLITGIVCAALTALVAIGGAKRIGKAASLLVPIMSVLYIAACCVVILSNPERILPGFMAVIEGGIGRGEAIIGGVGGYALTRAMRVGITRGVYSHEAGVGSSPMAFASCQCGDHRRQAMLGVTEVGVDTLVICTVTALMMLCSETAIPYGDTSADGMVLANAAMAPYLGEPLSSIFLAVSTTLFAYTSILTWSMYGKRCASYLGGIKAGNWFVVVYIAAVAGGAAAAPELAWMLGEAATSLMAMPNLIMVFALAPSVFRDERAGV